MATKVGSLVIIKLGGSGTEASLVGQTDMSFSSTRDLIDVSDKLGGIHALYEYGRKKNSVSVSGIAGTAAESTLKGFWEMYAYQLAGTKVSVTFCEYADNTAAAAVSGAKLVTMSCLIGKLDASYPDSKENKFSCELTVTGAPTVA